MTASKTTEVLKNHPKLLAALFGTSVLLTQVGAVAAGGGCTISG